jgi:hypothetical protein
VILAFRSAALCALSLLVLAAPAGAGPPGTWTPLNDAESNALEVGVARDGNGLLNILWSRGTEVLNTQISANARDVTGPHRVFVYDHPSGSAGPTALVAAPDGTLRAFFAGRYPGDPHDAGMSTATSADGVTWEVQPTLASDDRPGDRSPVHGAAGIGGAIWNGSPVSIWGDAAPNTHGYHIGTNSETPDVRFGTPGVTVTSPNAAADSSTGDLAVGWSDIDAGRTLVKFVQPTFDAGDFDPWFPPGPQIETPGGEAPDFTERVAMTGRSGEAPGIFIAYLRGTDPLQGRPTVWRIGSDRVVRGLPGGRGARFPGVAMAADGRLWAFWGRAVDDVWQVFAARSNLKATRFGAAVKVEAPGGADSTLFSLEGEGTAPDGALDLLALVQTSPDESDVDNHHQRIRPGITLNVRRLGDGEVRFRTRDAGARLATTIRFAGKTKRTGKDGKVVLSAQPGKKRTATAKAPGYSPASKRFKVK